jgi:hypothetical protein
MKLIKRRAYGFKSFENYRLRVIANAAKTNLVTKLWWSPQNMERAMRFELTTSTLARWRSTTELRPRCLTRRGLSTWEPKSSKLKFTNFPCSFSQPSVSLPARHVR